MKSRFEEFIEIDKFRQALGYVSRATGMAFWCSIRLETS